VHFEDSDKLQSLAPPLFTQQTFSTFNMDLVYTSNLDPFEGFNTEPVPTGH